MAKKREPPDAGSGEGQKIRIEENGPYRVTGGIPLATQRIVLDEKNYARDWKEDENFPAQESYLLCRCGRSKTRPFCDGIHTKVHFMGTEVASREPYRNQAQEYTGPDLTLTDATILCSAAGFCYRAGGIWKLTLESSNPEARAIAIDEAAHCPSGRLVVYNKQTRDAVEPPFSPSIGLVEYPVEGVSGPVWVRGRIPVESADGSLYEPRNRVTLCRCGHSFNKPFCDNSHLRWSPVSYKLERGETNR
jgi:CDGSH-type Zn-finger protein